MDVAAKVIEKIQYKEKSGQMSANFLYKRCQLCEVNHCYSCVKFEL